MENKRRLNNICYLPVTVFIMWAALFISSCTNYGAPSDLSYATQDGVYTINETIADNMPSVKGRITSWAVEPMLPVGLSIDPGTGVISGKPAAIQEKTGYTVTASNSQGYVSTQISITVNIAPPENLTYMYTDAVYNEGGRIINNIPTVTGSEITFSIDPALPSGLSLDPVTGVIWGTPSSKSDRTAYTVTAANSSGSVSAVIYITVTLSSPPSGLSYSSPAPVYTAGHAIADNVPTVTGSGIAFSVGPLLPDGLSIDPVTGIISGTPLSTQGPTDYTVTATNSKGSTTAIISIEITADALLASLLISAGTIYPNFDPVITDYTARLPFNTTSLTVTPGASDAAATISVTVNGAPPSWPADMNTGANTITIVVTASDAITTKTYTVRAVRGFLPEAYIKTGNTGPLDSFGQSSAISGDTLVVGSPYESSGQKGITNGSATASDNDAPGSGAVYVYRKTGGVWVQEAFIKASNADEYDYFGQSVAIDGDVIVVGAHKEDSGQKSITNGTDASNDDSSNASGAVYVFRRSSTTWTQEAYIKASNADPNDEFGWSVGISDDTIVVGAYLEDSNQTTITNGTSASENNANTSSGAAYVFRRTDGLWAQEAYLKASNNHASDYFGKSIAISDDTIAVGAELDDNLFTNTGAVYVYRRTGTTWAQEAFLKASNLITAESEYFGCSVSISGDTLVVGAYGETSNENIIINGTTGSTNHSSPYTGAVYVYKRTGITWAQEAYLKAPNAESGDYFGYRVAIYGDVIAVTAYYEASNDNICYYGSSASSDNTATRAGAVYVYKRSGATWSNDSYLKAPNSDTYDYFGTSISLWGNTIVIGAPGESSSQTGITNGITASSDNNALESGAVYIFAE